MPDPTASPASIYTLLPHINASLNALCACLLVAAIIAVKAKRVALHRALMLAALATSALFLACYLVYHAEVGSRPFQGQGAVRWVYFAILISHTLLAVPVPILAGVSAWRAYRGRIEEHRRIAKVAFPVWLYVSVTGVVVYAMLYHLFPA